MLRMLISLCRIEFQGNAFQISFKTLPDARRNVLDAFPAFHMDFQANALQMALQTLLKHPQMLSGMF